MIALIVDDNLINLKVAEKLISRQGVLVKTVQSGQECLDEVAKNTYDIIFMDIMMPEMDGVETFTKLKEMKGFNTPVVALTADVVSGAKEKYLGLGFMGYIPKPIDINLLKEILSKVNNNKKIY